MLRTLPHFPWTIEEWDEIGRGVTVLAGLVELGAAVAALKATIAVRPDRLMRLRYAPLASQGRGAEAFNFAIDEWDARDHVVAVHGVFVSLVPADAVFALVAAARPGRLVTMRKATRVLRRSLPASA